MPKTIPNTTLADPTAVGGWNEFAGHDRLAGGFFVVANNPAEVQMAVGQEGSLPQWGEGIYCPPGTYPMAAGARQTVAGVRARNALAGATAQFFGVMFFPGEAQVLASGPFDSTVAPGGGITPPVTGAVPLAGDYKVSARPTTHVEPVGGSWYLCDGSALPVAETALIALVGANVPDARGRVLTMLGTHGDVNAIGDNDGVALANRRPAHNHTVVQPAIAITDPQHAHGMGLSDAAGAATFNIGRGPNRNDGTIQTDAAATGITATASGGTVGPGGTAAVDKPAYAVPGNLFVYGTGA